MPPVATTLRIFDTRIVDKTERPTRVFATFDALPPGEAFVLVTDHFPKCMLPRFQNERPGQFEWSPLEQGPDVWRTEITKRADTTPRSVSEALAWDHDRLDTLEQEAFAARARGDYATAADIYRTFTLGLRRHIGFEEAVLFPEFEDRTGLFANAGPTAVMRIEHREIEAHLTEIEGTIGDPAADPDTPRRAMHLVLGEHNLKEERILYPGTDRVLSEAERDDLVRRIQVFVA